MKPYVLTIAALGVSASGFAQLYYTDATLGNAIEENCNLQFGFRNPIVTTTGSANAGGVSMNLKGHHNVELDRVPNATWSMLMHTAFSFEVGLTPVEITHFGFSTADFNGKLVIGGGRPATANVWVQYNWYEFDDADNDQVFDPTETVYDLGIPLGGTFASGELNGNGFAIYDGSVTGLSQDPFVLGAGKNYLFDIETELYGDIDALSTSPSTVVTHEFAAGWRGTTYNFEYAAVPEPSSIAILGLGALGFLRKRKRASN